MKYGFLQKHAAEFLESIFVSRKLKKKHLFC